MTDKHTPGPWIVEARHQNNLPNKYLIWAWEADRTLISSRVMGETNAKLIAAAPDLLEALELAQGYLEGEGFNLIEVDNALAAAKGK